MVWACIHVQLKDMGYIGKNAGISGVAKIFQHVPKAREQSDQVGRMRDGDTSTVYRENFQNSCIKTDFFFFFLLLFLAH